MINRFFILLGAVMAMLLLSNCTNTVLPMEESQYKKDNDAFVEKVDKGTEYTKLLFLNAEYPIYYKKLESGNSTAYPYHDSTVKMELGGRLITGEIFQPTSVMTYKVNELITGVQYALQSMNVGDKWEVVVPQQLGYGPYSQGYNLPGYSTLIFTIHLQEIKIQ